MTNKALSQADKDVPAESSPAPDGATNEPNDTDPVLPAGNQDSNGGDGDGDDPVKNVRAEMNRKLGKLDERFARFEGMLEGMSNVAPAQPAQPSSPTSLDDASSEQLEALRPNIPEDKLPAFEQLVAQRKQDERVDAQFDQRWSKQQLKQKRVEYNETAYGRYPELKASGSPMRTETNRVLDQMGDGADKNPRSVLDAANEAAVTLGIKPREGAHHTPHAPASGGRVYGKNGPANEPDAHAPDPARQQQIAESLAGALPSGKKFTEEQMKRIAERGAEYKKHVHLYVNKMGG